MNMNDELKRLMTLNAYMSTSDIERRIEKIAELLCSKFAIKKGEKIYMFKEIEFYFYNQNHKDIITHPRNSEALCWYVNDFGGIDINLYSHIETVTYQNRQGKMTLKYILNDTCFFGGILIRKLIEKDSQKLISGPWACADLFRCHSSLGYDEDFPILINYDSGKVKFNPESRLNILSAKNTPEKKVNNILYSYRQHPPKEELYDSFEEFKDKPYRYVRK